MTVLDSLCRQAVATPTYEIIVIDNGSTDQTVETVRHYAQHHPNIRYCYEPDLGHAAARNRAWREAKGKYVAYIDDDAYAPENWLSTAVGIIQARSAKVFGGPYRAFYKSPKPSWFKDEYGANMVTSEARWLNENEYLSATNLFVHRDLLDAVDGFDRRYGGIGRRLGYAEETELQQRVRGKIPDTKIYADPHLYVFHLVKPERMRMAWLIRSRFILGRSRYYAFAGEQLRRASLFEVAVASVLQLAQLIVRLTWGTMLRNRQLYPFWQNYLFERCLGTVTTIGKYYEHGWLLVENRRQNH